MKLSSTGELTNGAHPGYNCGGACSVHRPEESMKNQIDKAKNSLPNRASGAPKRSQHVASADTPGPWIYRPNPGSTKEDWTFHIDRQGTPGRMNWGVLIAACWGHVSESAEANARLIAAAPALYEGAMLIINNGQCERYSTGLGSCGRNGRTKKALMTIDRWCHCCIAYDALAAVTQQEDQDGK